MRLSAAALVQLVKKIGTLCQHCAVLAEWLRQRICECFARLPFDCSECEEGIALKSNYQALTVDSIDLIQLSLSLSLAR